MRRCALVLLLALNPIACCHRPASAPVAQQPAEAPVSITRECREEPVGAVLEFIARKSGHSILLERGIEEKISVNFINTPWREAVETACDLANLTTREEGGCTHVEKPRRVAMEVRRAHVTDFVLLIAKEPGIGVVIDRDAKGEVTLRFRDEYSLKALEGAGRSGWIVVIEEDGRRVPWKDVIDQMTKVVEEQDLEPAKGSGDK